MHCPICFRDDPLPLLDLGEAPVFCNVQWPSREAALRAAKAPIRLVTCARCGHVFNEAFDPRIVGYSPGYENSQHSSTVFGAYARRLVERLAVSYSISGRAIVDVGCGRGELLRLLAERVNGRGYGFDPSYSGRTPSTEGRSVSIVRESFSAEHARSIQPALICCRHVLEHLGAPTDFLSRIRDAMSECGNPVLYLEVPNGTYLFRNAVVWDVLYEHVSYFSAESLRLALERSGFDVLDIYEDFGGQFLCADAIVGKAATARLERLGGASAVPSGAGPTMLARIERWKRWASAASRQRRTAAIWGTGTKGVMFLNLLGLGFGGPIARALDQNAAKNGLFVPCTGQRISLPSSDALEGLSSLILMNSIYAREVAERIASLEVSVELLAAD